MRGKTLLPRFGCFCLLLLGVTGTFISTSLSFDVSPQTMYEASVPSDGDSWTENNNATYTWKFHTSYRTNNLMSFVTSDVKAGSYALNVTHGQSATYMYFRLVLDQNYDVSNYDVFSFWMKATSSDSSYDLIAITFNPTDTNWDSTNHVSNPLGCEVATYNGTWAKYIMPIALFDGFGSANLSSIRQIYFKFYQLASASGTVLLVDNLQFSGYDLDGTATTQLEMMPMAWYSLKGGEYKETISGTNYTTMYDWLNLTSKAKSSTSLEMEVVGQTIFALCFAYNKTGFSFYLDDAKDLGEIILLGQENNGQGKGGVPNYYRSGWDEDMSSLYNGWMLAGVSFLYHLTSSNTYKTFCDLNREFLCGVMWNSTNKVANGIFDNDTQTMQMWGSTFNAMYDGAYSLGLACYYKFVSNNATVLSILKDDLNSGLTSTTWTQRMAFDGAKWENNAYAMWGLHMGYLATSNATYKDGFVNATKMLIVKQMQHPTMNGSAARYNGYPFIWQPSVGFNDGWGLHCSLPLFLLANDLEAHSYFVNHTELSLFNHLYSTLTNEGALQRANGGIYDDRQYYGTPSYVVLALQLYHLEKNTDLYIVGSTAKTSNIRITPVKMTFTLTGSGTSTTYTYCGSRGEPATVTGATSWSYDSDTKIVTINVLHTISKEIILDFTEHTSPTTTISLSGVLGNNDWFISEVTVILSAVDDISGVDKTEYSINNDTWKTYSTPFTLNTDGFTIVCYKSTDKVGNVEKIKTETIKIDGTAPSGSIMINNGDAYTTSTSVMLTLNATDSTSGLNEVRFSNDGLLDTESWENLSPTKAWILMSGDGMKTVCYQVKDNAGLVSIIYSDDILLDTDSPTGSVVVAGGSLCTNSTSVTLTLSADDITSGVAQMHFSNDGTNWSDWEPYSASRCWTLTTGEGTKTLCVRYMDNAGLTSATYQDSIVLDTTKPVANAGQNRTVRAGETVAFYAGDSTDNVGIVSYQWVFGDGITGTDLSVNHTYANPGSYIVTLTVRDVAGNTDADSISVTVVAAPDFPMWILGAIIIAGIAIVIAIFFKRHYP